MLLILSVLPFWMFAGFDKMRKSTFVDVILRLQKLQMNNMHNKLHQLCEMQNKMKNNKQVSNKQVALRGKKEKKRRASQQGMTAPLLAGFTTH